MHFRSRWLFLQFTSREMSNRFAGSVLGGLWAFVHPLALLLVYGLVFSAVFSVRLPAAAGSSYLVFVAVALWPWLAFQEAVIRGTSAVTANAALVKKVPFEHALLVFSAVSACFAIHLFGYLVVLAVLAVVLALLLAHPNQRWVYTAACRPPGDAWVVPNHDPCSHRRVFCRPPRPNHFP